MRPPTALQIRSDDLNGVIVAESDGLAVATFYYQRGSDGQATFDASALAGLFMACVEAQRLALKPAQS